MQATPTTADLACMQAEIDATLRQCAPADIPDFLDAAEAYLPGSADELCAVAAPQAEQLMRDLNGVVLQ